MPDGGFGEVMENALATIGAMYPEEGGTMDRMITQGRAELASALFGESDAYVAYGDGQKAVEVEAPQPEVSQAPQVEAPQVQQEISGMEL